MKVLSFRESRNKVHEEAIKFCQDILKKKSVELQTLSRSNLSQPIHDVDLVVTVSGDGTLLHASHFMDDSIPVLGVNSDPTTAEEVEALKEEYDATRSAGYLCAATVGNFEQMLDHILEGRLVPSKLTRMSIHLNSKLQSTYALNDVLIAHPCPATMSRFSFRIDKDDGQPSSPLVHSRSSGLRASTATGSTAAMLSSGGYIMPILSQDLQYMVREPLLHSKTNPSLIHGVVKHNENMEIEWFCQEGTIYIDGAEVVYTIKLGDIIKLSSNAPVLNIFLPKAQLVESRM